MALARWFIVLVSSIAAAALIVAIYFPTIDKCTAASKIMEDPIVALQSTYAGDPPATFPCRPEPCVVLVDHFRGPCTSENWWGPLTIWLLVWGPICATLVGEGYVAARHGGPPSFTRSALTAAIATVLALGVFLSPEFRMGKAIPTQWLENSLALVCIAGAIGVIGAALAKRQA